LCVVAGIDPYAGSRGTLGTPPFVVVEDPARLCAMTFHAGDSCIEGWVR
jgi:hypothetical protein